MKVPSTFCIQNKLEQAMKCIHLIIMLTLLLLQGCSNSSPARWTIFSPDQRLTVTVGTDQTGQPYYSLTEGPDIIIEESPLGMIFLETYFREDLTFVSAEKLYDITDSYTLLTGKRKENKAIWNEMRLRFMNQEGRSLVLNFRLFDEGVAFNYEFLEPAGETYTLVEELTGFKIPKNSKAWIHPYAAVSTWSPAYETYFEKTPAGASAPDDQDGWAFPMLFHTGSQWMLITDADLREGYVGMSVGRDPEGGLYTLKLPNEDEALGLCPSQPVLDLPFTTPWRVVITGKNPGVIVESNLVYHVSTPNVISDTSWIKPGRAGWSWWSESESPKDFDRLKEFVDFTSEMGWEYFLVDANWNHMEGGTVRELTAYASSIGVDIAIWYNSGGPHNVITEEPRDLMHIREIRRKEFQKISEWGVRGIKVDFFQSDKACILNLYHEILRDAADFRITVNFHGSTIPRGWERTYPHLLTMEAVRATESYRYDAAYPDRAPAHNTILPFTRNVIGPMDFTPVPFSDATYPKKTTHAHELALAVLFESGLQHFADNDHSYLAQPQYVIDYLKKVPAVWDDTRFVAGYPGEMVVIARRKGGKWYLSGINGTNGNKSIQLNLDFLPEGNYRIDLIADGADQNSFRFEELPIGPDRELTVETLPRGGFAAVIEKD